MDQTKRSWVVAHAGQCFFSSQATPWQTRYRTSRALLPPFLLACQGLVLRRSVASFPFVVVVTHHASIHASSPLAHRLLPPRKRQPFIHAKASRARVRGRLWSSAPTTSVGALTVTSCKQAGFVYDIACFFWVYNVHPRKACPPDAPFALSCCPSPLPRSFPLSLCAPR